jgi:hypothetical protein
MVVAAQFPLSFEGSVRLVEVLYEGLLWGTDPRRLLYDLRRQLYSQFPARHDWASLTAYVTLPPDFDRQLPQVQVKRVMGSIDAAMNHADEVTRRFHKESKRQLKKTGSRPEPPERTRQVVDTARGKIDQAKSRLEALLECMPSESALIHGLLASTEKREAEVIHSAARHTLSKLPQEDYAKAIDLLASAQEHYWNAFLIDRSSSWPIVQYLSLRQVLRNKNLEPNEPGRPEKGQESNLGLAHALAGYELRSPSPQIRIWAHASLMEIYLLSLALKPFPNAEENALRHATELIDLAGRDSFDVYSSRRQILRYCEWFPEISTLSAKQGNLARTISKRFPEDVEEMWR